MSQRTRSSTELLGRARDKSWAQPDKDGGLQPKWGTSGGRKLAAAATYGAGGKTEASTERVVRAGPLWITLHKASLAGASRPLISSTLIRGRAQVPTHNCIISRPQLKHRAEPEQDKVSFITHCSLFPLLLEPWGSVTRNTSFGHSPALSAGARTVHSSAWLLGTCHYLSLSSEGARSLCGLGSKRGRVCRTSRNRKRLGSERCQLFGVSLYLRSPSQHNTLSSQGRVRFGFIQSEGKNFLKSLEESRNEAERGHFRARTGHQRCQRQE